MPETVTLAEPQKTNGAVQRFDPFGLLDTLQQEFEAVWRRPFFVGTGPWPVVFPAITSRAAHMPRLDMYEKEGTLIVKAELPGLRKEDVEVEIVEGDLVIKGTHAVEKEVKESHYYRMERAYGTFYRRLPLPFEVTAEQITAMLTDGILEVKIPKPVTTAPPTTKVPVA
jgi:HSP20 family protein